MSRHAGEAIEALIAHLEEEAEQLARLTRALEEEAGALRRLDLEAMASTAAAKVQISEAHQALALARPPLLRAAVPGLPAETLSAVRTRFVQTGHVEAEARVARLQQEMLAHAERIGELHRRNAAFAETGRACISRALDHVRRLHAGVDGTYTGAGRMRTDRAGVLVRRKG